MAIRKPYSRSLPNTSPISKRTANDWYASRMLAKNLCICQGGLMNGYKFRTALAKIAPDYQIEEDNDGQIVIYTNLQDDGNDNYIPYEYIERD